MCEEEQRKCEAFPRKEKKRRGTDITDEREDRVFVGAEQAVDGGKCDIKGVIEHDIEK